MNLRRALPAALAVLCALYTFGAYADDTTPPGTVTWEAPPECSETLFRERMRPTRPSVFVRVHIENRGRQATPNYRGTLEIDTAKRSVESAHCDEVVRALALAGNMLLDRDADEPKPIAPSAAPLPSQAPGPDASPPPERLPRANIEGQGIFLAGSGVLTDGTRAMPVIALTAMSTLDLSGKKVALGLGGELQWRFASAESGAYTAFLFWLSARYQTCALFFGETPFRLGPCANAEFGISHGEVSGAVDATAQTRFWSAAGPSLRAFWIPERRRSFVVGIHGAALFPLTRTRFVVTQGPVLYAPPTLQPEVTISLGYTFQ